MTDTIHPEQADSPPQEGRSRLVRRVRDWTVRTWRGMKPGRRAWRGAAIGLLVVAVVLWVVQISGFTAAASPLYLAPGLFVAGLLAAALLGWLTSSLIEGLAALPALYRWALFVAIIAAVNLGLLTETGPGMVVFSLAVVVVASLVGAGTRSALGGWRRLTGLQRGVTAAGLVLGVGALAFGVYWLLDGGSMPEAQVNAAALSAENVEPLTLPDPSLPGDYGVLTLTYGSGEDRHREEYGAGADLMTEPVDASAFVGGWDGLVGTVRTAYWGFDAEALPLNARVWYPDGEGPFPLVLVVHGNHLAEDFSDPGYDYLGELLASRGYIVASVDENFLNGAWDMLLGGLKEENDARGWLLLEHLSQWRAWSEAEDNPFGGKVDMDSIALIGHSRGGEAVAIAAAFNRLPAYPDNAVERFDYDFNIRSVIGIAPIDGQYRPAGVGTPLTDVNYFVLHGSYDGDAESFSALAQYDRVQFSEGFDGFKAALYIHRANHGQFNTTWGRRSDAPGQGAIFYNLEPILPAGDQRQIAEVTISAFLDATLRGETGYRPIFRDARLAGDWLPEAITLQQMAESGTRFISTFDEDLDLHTATLSGATQQGRELTVWREHRVNMKWGTRDTNAVSLGWNHHTNLARYVITLPDDGVSTGEDAVLVFSLADANQSPTAGEEVSDNREPIDLTVELVDGAGERAQLPLSHVALLQPQLEAQVKKLALFNDGATSEPIFQTYAFPLADFAAANPDFDPDSLSAIRFVFDRTPEGVVLLDDVGLRHVE